jgi:hypothetical protein
MANQYIIDRKLPERAKLVFYFPNPSEGKEHQRVIMPFFENPTIKESKKARFKKFSLISRSSDLYAYTGAESRQFQLSFNMTLPHIIEDHPEILTEDFIYKGSMSDDPKTEQERFKSPVAAPPNVNSMSLAYSQRFWKDSEGLQSSAKQVLLSLSNGGLSDVEKTYIKTLYDLTNNDVAESDAPPTNNGYMPNPQTLDEVVELSRQGIEPKFWNGPMPIYERIPPSEPTVSPADALDEQSQLRMKTLDLVMFWVNLIRSSVVNNAQNSIYGPPVVRLRHGLLYQDVPCLCQSYTLSWDEKAGYDLQTLLPRQLKITMKLVEFRTGDFGVFDQNEIIEKDNLAGWEAVLGEPHTMDPGYNTI